MQLIAISRYFHDIIYANAASRSGLKYDFTSQPARHPCSDRIAALLIILFIAHTNSYYRVISFGFAILLGRIGFSHSNWV